MITIFINRLTVSLVLSFLFIKPHNLINSTTIPSIFVLYLITLSSKYICNIFPNSKTNKLLTTIIISNFERLNHLHLNYKYYF